MAGEEHGEVRLSIDTASLERYLASNVPQISVPLKVRQFKAGQSNPTYFLTDAKNKQFVLRKKPPGQLLSKTAHAVEREYRVIKTVGELGHFPVPKVYVLCEDVSVIGTPFYIMEFMKGRIFTDVRLPGIKSQSERRAIWFNLIKTLADLHRLSPDALGLTDFAPPHDFYPRQVRSLAKIQKSQAAVRDLDTNAQVGQVPGADALSEFYMQHAPVGERTIVHGDYKLDNVVFHETKPEIIAVLDWEMSTLGHPIADLANCLMPFSMPQDYAVNSSKSVVCLEGIPPEKLPIPSAEELLKCYSEAYGRPYPIKAWPYALSFTHYKAAIIFQGIAARYARRQASSATAHFYHALIPSASKRAIRQMEDIKTGKAKL